MPRRKQDAESNGSRAGLRVLDILLALGQTSGPQSLRTLHEKMDLPRASLHRLLRALETAGFLQEEDDGFVMGPQSFRLARLISGSLPQESNQFPQCARPVLEWLANETCETVILGVLSDSRKEIVYADVIVAESPLQYAVPMGDRRPLYSSATGKAVLAFLSPEEQKRYLDEADFQAITPFTTRREQIDALLEKVRARGVIYDRDGHFIGAGAVASPIFDRKGAVFAAVVVAGPNERIEQSPVNIELLVREAGTGISRIVGYDRAYPATWPPEAGAD